MIAVKNEESVLRRILDLNYSYLLRCNGREEEEKEEAREKSFAPRPQRYIDN